MEAFYKILAALLCLAALGMCCVTQSARDLIISVPFPKDIEDKLLSCGDRTRKSEGAILNIPTKGQESANWCSIAVFEMLREYFGDPATQCLIASERAGRFIGESATATTTTINCCDAWAKKETACANPTEEEDFPYLFTRSGLYADLIKSPLSEHIIQNELSNGRPIVAGYHYANPYCKGHNAEPQCYGHTVIIIGYLPPNSESNARPETVYILIDPAYGKQFQFSYKELLLGEIIYREWPWTEGRMITMIRPWKKSWMRISPRPDRCAEIYDPLCGCGSPP